MNLAPWKRLRPTELPGKHILQPVQLSVGYTVHLWQVCTCHKLSLLLGQLSWVISTSEWSPLLIFLQVTTIKLISLSIWTLMIILL